MRGKNLFPIPVFVSRCLMSAEFMAATDFLEPVDRCGFSVHYSTTTDCSQRYSGKYVVYTFDNIKNIAC